MIRKCGMVLFAVAVLLQAAELSAQTTLQLKRIVSTGDSAPVPAQLSSIQEESFNEQGQLAFTADDGLFLKSGKKLTLIAGLGDLLPNGDMFRIATAPSINSQGQIVFRGLTTGTNGLFLYSQGTITLLVPDFTLIDGNSVIPTQGFIADNGDLIFADGASGIYRSSNGNFTAIANSNHGTPEGFFFAAFTNLEVNPSGQVLFTGFTFFGGQGLFLASNGSITKVVATGDSLPDGNTLLFPISAGLNDNGEVAFSGLSSFLFQQSVYLYTNGRLQTLVPPITNTGLSFDGFPSVSLNNTDQVVFTGSSAGQQGVFLFQDGNITQILSQGEATPDGDILSNNLSGTIDNSGQVLVTAQLVHHINAVYLLSGTQLTRLAGSGDRVAVQPKFDVPFAAGAGSDDQVLIDDFTFPGHEGFFTAISSPSQVQHINLDANDGEPLRMGLPMRQLLSPHMNSQGSFTFEGDLGNGLISLVQSSGNELTEIVRASFFPPGDPAPGGGNFLALRGESLNSSGQVLFSAQTSGASGLFMSDHGKVQLLLDENTPSPDGTGFLDGIGANAINDQGQIVFATSGSASGIYLLSNGQITTIARDGRPAPGGGAFDLTFVSVTSSALVMNNNGDVAFFSDLSTGSTAVFLYSHGRLVRIAGPGSVSPVGNFLAADSPTINSAGQVAFTGSTPSALGVFLYSGGRVSKIAVIGDLVAPDPNLAFNFIGSPFINDLGHVAFGALLSDGTGATFMASWSTGAPAGQAVIVPGSGLPSAAIPLSPDVVKPGRIGTSRAATEFLRYPR